MNLFISLTMPNYFSDIVKRQKEMAKKVICTDLFDGRIENICGVDVSYKNNIAYCSAVIVNRSFKILKNIKLEIKVNYPYIPGLFVLREFEPIISVLGKIDYNEFDILIIDGHGRLHPRKCGLACSVGLYTDRPTIGVAKKLLCGNIREDNFIEVNSEVVGYVMDIQTGGKTHAGINNNNNKNKNRNKHSDTCNKEDQAGSHQGHKRVFISTGHKVSLESSIRIVQNITKKGEWLPEPLRLADRYSKDYRLLSSKKFALS